MELFLSEIKQKPFSLADHNKYTEDLYLKFSPKVKNDDIEILLHSINQIISLMSKDLCGKIEEISKDIEMKLNNQAATFIDQLQSALRDKAKLLEDGVKNKEQNIIKLDMALEKLISYKEGLRKFANSQIETV